MTIVVLPEASAKEHTMRAIEILLELGLYLSIQYASTIRSESRTEYAYLLRDSL
jgi:hypothetical protein